MAGSSMNAKLTRWAALLANTNRWSLVLGRESDAVHRKSWELQYGLVGLWVAYALQENTERHHTGLHSWGKVTHFNACERGITRKNKVSAASRPSSWQYTGRRCSCVDWMGILLYILGGEKNRILVLSLYLQCFFTCVTKTNSCVFSVISVSQILVLAARKKWITMTCLTLNVIWSDSRYCSTESYSIILLMNKDNVVKSHLWTRPHERNLAQEND